MKMQAGTTPNGFGLLVHLAGLVMVPAGVRRARPPLTRLCTGAMGSGFGLGGSGVGRPRAPAWLGGAGCLARPLSPRMPASSLPASSSSSTSRRREEEREGETLELTQSKTRESKTRVVGGNTDVLQAYRRPGNGQGEALGGMGWRTCCGPGPLKTHQGCASWPWLGVQATCPAAHPSHQPPMAPTSSFQPVPSRTNSCFPSETTPWQCSQTTVPNGPGPLQDYPINPGAK